MSFAASILRCLLVLTLAVNAIGRPAQLLAMSLAAPAMGNDCAMHEMRASKHAHHAAAAADAHDAHGKSCCETGKRCDCDFGSPVSLVIERASPIAADPATAPRLLRAVSFESGVAFDWLRPPIV